MAYLKELTVGELRKAIEGLDDGVEVLVDLNSNDIEFFTRKAKAETLINLSKDGKEEVGQMHYVVIYGDVTVNDGDGYMTKVENLNINLKSGTISTGIDYG